MTVHLVCHDCELEGLIPDEDEADRLAENHKEEHGHDVETLVLEDRPVSRNARNVGCDDA